MVVCFSENGHTVTFTEMRNHDTDIVCHIVDHCESGYAAGNVHLCFWCDTDVNRVQRVQFIPLQNYYEIFLFKFSSLLSHIDVCMGSKIYYQE